MLKIMIIFMLLTLIGSPMNTPPLDHASVNNTSVIINNTNMSNISVNNTSINKSLFNNSYIDDTQQGEQIVDIRHLNWFKKPTKPNAALDLKLTLENIKREYLMSLVESFSAEKATLENDLSSRFIPPVIDMRPESRPKHDMKDPMVEPKPKEPFDEWDPWLLTPPWETEMNGEYSGQVSIEEQSMSVFRIYSC
ncbi:hypothetical protein [Methanothrix sp.]|jgi:hypothetical protein|uniref:hypothetical protein n=1 Tax=Methanothrix sp. TaxID=90426 RepID=UPI001BD2865D